MRQQRMVGRDQRAGNFRGATKIAVQAFLDRRIGFLDIPRVVAAALDEDVGSNGMAGDLQSVLGIDARARVLAEEICQRVGT